MSMNELKSNSARRDLCCDAGLPDILKKVKALILDLDGTVTDSIGNILVCMRTTFEALGAPPPEDDAVRQTIGMTLEEGMAALLGEKNQDQALVYCAEYRRIFNEHPEFNRDVLFPGIEILLKKLSRRGLKIGVASGRSRAGVVHTLDNTVVGDYCEAFVSGSETPSKPAGDMAVLLCMRLGLDTTEVLGVGDSALDVEMYHRAGCPALGVETGVCSGPDFLAMDTPPEVVLPSLSALAYYIN